MSDDNKYCTSENKKFYDVYGNEIEPTTKAKKDAQDLTTLEEAVRQLRINRGDQLRHASTMDEVWELATLVDEKAIEGIHKKLVKTSSDAAKAEIKRRKQSKAENLFEHLFEDSIRFPFVEHPDPDNFVAWVAEPDGIRGISITKLETKTGEKYLMHHPLTIPMPNEDATDNMLFFTRHFLERYAERNEIDKHEDLDIAKSALLRSYLTSPPGCLNFDRVRGRASSLLVFTDGIGLGQAIINEGKQYNIVKTFLPYHMLKENQLSAIDKLKELQNTKIRIK